MIGLFKTSLTQGGGARKRPFSCPNSSDSMRSLGIAAMFKAMNGRLLRGECRCSACATSSLPVPDSPLISTVMCDCDKRPIARNTSCMAGDSPMISTLFNGDAEGCDS